MRTRYNTIALIDHRGRRMLGAVASQSGFTRRPSRLCTSSTRLT